MPNSFITDVRTYAIRRVNPFLGVLQVIENDGGRAISANGIVWDIEVRAERNSAWGSLNRSNKEAAYYRYGLWSQEEGLVSRPLSPHLDNDPLTLKCNKLIADISKRLDQLPFQLKDNIELWLFDEEGETPIALLASVITDASRPSPDPKYWSSCVGANGVPSQRRFPAASELEAMVKHRAGFNINNFWVTRHTDGSGVIEVSCKELTADVFPSCLLTEDWPDTEQAKLAHDYIEWIAPSLLTLQQLSKPERARLENSLNTQAISVEHHWHLYPEIIDEKNLTAARVQCRLEKANQ